MGSLVEPTSLGLVAMPCPASGEAVAAKAMQGANASMAASTTANRLVKSFFAGFEFMPFTPYSIKTAMPRADMRAAIGKNSARKRFVTLPLSMGRSPMSLPVWPFIANR